MFDRALNRALFHSTTPSLCDGFYKKDIIYLFLLLLITCICFRLQTNEYFSKYIPKNWNFKLSFLASQRFTQPPLASMWHWACKESICDRPLICLDKSHISKFCQKSSSYRKCNKRLSISICTFSRRQTESMLKEKINASSSNTTSTSFSGNSNSFLLQTASAAAYTIDNKTLQKGRTLFNSSSQWSYITKNEEFRI